MASRGEVWLVDLGMIQKVRPALVLNRSFKLALVEAGVRNWLGL